MGIDASLTPWGKIAMIPENFLEPPWVETQATTRLVELDGIITNDNSTRLFV